MAKWVKVRGITDADRTILHFIWRWKLLPTAAIHKSFFADRHATTTYRRLRALQKQGYLVLLAIDESASRFAWSLTAKSFKVVQSSLPDLEQVGFCSEALEHDYLVSAIHLGPWLTAPPSLEVFSEQEIRRYPVELFPVWVPKTKIHLPDGYWANTEGGETTIIALEVERFPKTSSSYEAVANFYAEEKNISMVVWAVPRPGQVKSIMSSLKKYCPKSIEVHHFVLISDLVKLGWQAELAHGYSSGKSLFEVVTPNAKTPQNFASLPGLDGSKSGYLSGSYDKTSNTPKSNRVAP